MGIPWSYGPNQFEVQRGQANLVELRVPHRGVLRNINLSYLDDDLGSGTFEIFTLREAAEAAAQVTEDSDASEGSLGEVFPTTPYSLAGQLSIAAGKHLTNGANWAYQNRDGSPSNGVRRLWLVVSPAGAGVADMILTMTIDTQ